MKIGCKCAFVGSHPSLERAHSVFVCVSIFFVSMFAPKTAESALDKTLVWNGCWALWKIKKPTSKLQSRKTSAPTATQHENQAQTVLISWKAEERKQEENNASKNYQEIIHFLGFHHQRHYREACRRMTRTPSLFHFCMCHNLAAHEHVFTHCEIEREENAFSFVIRKMSAFRTKLIEFFCFFRLLKSKNDTSETGE